MKLDRLTISRVLTEEGIAFSLDPEGFDLPGNAMLRSGSGIAGKGNEWFLWFLDGTTSTGSSAKNIGELRGLLRKSLVK